MQEITTSSSLLVQAKLIRMLAEIVDIDPVVIQKEIQDYLVENGVTSQGYFYDRHAVPAATWIITHNLNKYPQVALFDDNGLQFDADVFYTNPNQVTVVFAEPTSGKAVLI